MGKTCMDGDKACEYGARDGETYVAGGEWGQYCLPASAYVMYMERGKEEEQF